MTTIRTATSTSRTLTDPPRMSEASGPAACSTRPQRRRPSARPTPSRAPSGNDAVDDDDAGRGPGAGRDGQGLAAIRLNPAGSLRGGGAAVRGVLQAREDRGPGAGALGV